MKRKRKISYFAPAGARAYLAFDASLTPHIILCNVGLKRICPQAHDEVPLVAPNRCRFGYPFTS
jgi:hypothetical protein